MPESQLGPSIGVGESKLLGVGILPSHVCPVESDHASGHMWLYWAPDEETPIRGYYPDISQLPVPWESIKPVDKFVKFFTENAVPGLMTREDMSQYEPYKDEFHDKKWEIIDAQHERVRRRCQLPPGEDEIEDGLYSLMVDKDGHNNCVSWALEVVDFVMETKEYLKCPRTSRLKHVLIALGPKKDKDDGS
jgi:hypothetical protein